MISHSEAPRRTVEVASLPLSPEDRHMLEVESSISPDYIAGRGYYTASKLTDVPEVFKGRQWRLGLVIPTYSPSGARGFRLRPKVRISREREQQRLDACRDRQRLLFDAARSAGLAGEHGSPGF